MDAEVGIFIVGVISAILTVAGFLIYDIYQQLKRRARLQKAAFEEGLKFDGKGFGTVTLSGVQIGRNINYTFYRQSSRFSKAYVAPMEILIAMELPYSLELKTRQDFVSRRMKQSMNPTKDGESPKTVDEAFSVFATDYRDVQPLLTHPVVESILLELEAKMRFSHEFLTLHPDGITYHTFADWIHQSSPGLPDLTEPVFKLTLYLAQPKHLSPVASVSRTLEALTDALVAGSNEVVIEHSEPEPHTKSAGPPPNDTPAGDAPSEKAAVAETDVAEEGAVAEESEFALIDYLIKASDSEIATQECAREIASRGEYWIEQTVTKLADHRLRAVSRQILEALNERAVPAMIRHLDDFRITHELKDILNNLDAEAAQAVVEQLDSTEDEDTIRNLLELTSNLKPDGAVEEVKRFLNSDNYGIRYDAKRTLRRLGLDYDQIGRMK